MYSNFYLNQILSEYEDKINNLINKQDRDYIINMNDNDIEKFINKIENEVNLKINIYFNKKDILFDKEDIPAEKFPKGYCVRKGSSCETDIITVKIPYDGSYKLLNNIKTNKKINIENNNIYIKIVRFSETDEEIENIIKNTITEIMQQHNRITEKINDFNIKQKIREKLKEKINKLNRENNSRNNIIKNLI